jgi:hypothetical protein
MGELKEGGRKTGHQVQGLTGRRESFSRLFVEIVCLGEFRLGSGVRRCFRSFQQGIPE